MRTSTMLIGCLLVSGLCACSEVGIPLATNMPIMVGPVTQVGGKPVAPKPPVNEKLAFDPDVENSIWICWASGYPSASRVSPLPADLVAKIGAANSQLAGQIPLRTVTARVDEVPVGAYVWFGGGCYGHSWWWTGDGRVETP